VQGTTENRRKPNIIIVFPDQFRADLCGAYGGRWIKTPNIDHLGSEGVTFTRALSTCPVCTPYRGMLMTGRYPTHSGIMLNFIEASPVQNPHSLAQTFRAAGYDTGFIGKWHLSAGAFKCASTVNADIEAAKRYLQSHPDPEFTPPGPARLGFEYWAAYNFLCEFNKYRYYRDKPELVLTGRYETDVQFDQAIEYIKNRGDSTRPFLLVIAPHPPHPPLAPGACPSGYLAQVPPTLDSPPNVPSPNPRPEHELRCYLAMAKNVDDNVGKLVRFLDESGMSKDTLLVFTSDHGEMHGSHARLNKMVPYAEAVNVPLIMRWPGVIPPRIQNESPYTPMDHLPTLCALAGIDTPGALDGMDLSRAVRSTETISREVLTGNYSSDWNFFQTGTQWPEWRGVHTGQYTYCRWLAGGEELYDNKADPYQMTNLVQDGGARQVLDRLRSRLTELMAEAHDEFWPGPRYADWFDNERNLVRTGLGPVST
jgi:arylsulfatase A-like enzyme